MKNALRHVLLVAFALLVAGIAGTSAQDASPAATPGTGVFVVEPSNCLVEPRPEGETLPDVTPVSRESVESEDDLPQGEPANQELADIIVAIEREAAACINDGDAARLAALMTDELAADFLTQFEDASGGATPDPELDQVELTLLAVRDVRVLDDGRLGAVVVWVLERQEQAGAALVQPELETNFHIYEEVDGRWLLAEEIPIAYQTTQHIPVEGGWLLDEDEFGTRYVYEMEGTPTA